MGSSSSFIQAQKRWDLEARRHACSTSCAILDLVPFFNENQNDLNRHLFAVNHPLSVNPLPEDLSPAATANVPGASAERAAHALRCSPIAESARPTNWVSILGRKSQSLSPSKGPVHLPGKSSCSSLEVGTAHATRGRNAAVACFLQWTEARSRVVKEREDHRPGWESLVRVRRAPQYNQSCIEQDDERPIRTGAG